MFLIFTDLDGSLLDHADYSFEEPARPSTESPVKGGHSSSSRARPGPEVEPLQRRMGIEAPFVVENGAAAFFPSSLIGLDIPGVGMDESPGALVFGRPYAEVRRFVNEVREEYGLRGFGDMEAGRSPS